MATADIKYRVQLPPDLRWSEWRTWDEPTTEPLILSVQLSKQVSLEQYNTEIAPKLKQVIG